MAKKKWVQVVFAADLPACDCCEEPFCPKHQKHFADCSCIGPTQDGYEYKDQGGVLRARKRK